MEPEETAGIVRYVKALCPQQAIDDFTYDAWHDVIGHLTFEAARNAVIAVIHSQPFVAPSDIIREAFRAAKAHPSDRSVGEALESANRRELDPAGAAPPNAEYLAAKAVMIERMKARDEAAYLADHAAERKAAAHLSHAVSGKQATEWPLAAPAAPRWVQLPGDPPELRAWLARQPPDADGPN